jgi:phage gpG-like protein
MIRLNFIGLDATIRHLEGIRARLRDLRPAWLNVLAYLRRVVVGQFATEGAKQGTPWRPLSARYKQWKAVKYPGQPILRASDRMFRSLLGSHPDAIVDVQPQRFTYGTKTPYARYHQRGTRKMSKREILVVTDNDRREVKAIMRRHLENQAALSGFSAARP